MIYNKKEIIVKLETLAIKLDRRPVKRDNSHLNFLSKKYFGSWNNMMNYAGYKCKTFQKPLIPAKMTDDLYYFLGLISTDGHIQIIKERSVYRVMLYTSENEEKEIILKLIDKLFSYKAGVRERNTGFSKRLNYEIYVSSKKIAEYLNGLGIPYGHKSYNLKLPKLISHCDSESFGHYLRGVFDGDGSIINDGHNHIFKITSGSVSFLEELKNIMILNGINGLKVSLQNKNVWELRTNSKNEISKIYSLIYKEALFFYPRKRNKWEKQHV